MGLIIKWGLTVIVGVAAGIWFAANETDFSTIQSIVILVGSIIFISYLIYFIYSVYVLRFSKNIKEVGNFLKKAHKRPYYSALIDILNGDFKQAEDTLQRIKNKQQHAPLAFILHIENRNIDAAKKEIANMNNATIRDFNNAVVAMLENDWSAFEQFKSKIKDKGLQFSLEADAAFRKGNPEEAERYGDLAISNTAGLQRFILIKSLERQKRNPNRESYF